MNDSTPTRRSGFTLIELLIVVAIIAILAAIAVPNFLEAQTRSKVSRVRADQRSVATALESYYVDENHYPPELAMPGATGFTTPAIGPHCSWNAAHPVGSVPCEPAQVTLVRLTTPIAYMSTVEAMHDPFITEESAFFAAPDDKIPYESFFYLNYEDFTAIRADPNPPALLFTAWTLISLGPDAADDGTAWAVYMVAKGDQTLDQVIAVNPPYDPTNGTVSRGDILRVAGSEIGNAQALQND